VRLVFTGSEGRGGKWRTRTLLDRQQFDGFHSVIPVSHSTHQVVRVVTVRFIDEDVGGTEGEAAAQRHSQPRIRPSPERHKLIQRLAINAVNGGVQEVRE